MALNSRRKGKVGELEAAQALRDLFGWECARSVQHSGTEDSADLRVTSTPGLWFEVKRVQNLNVPKTMEKAVEQAGRRTAVLLHRKNHGEWLLTIRLSDLPRLAHAFDCAEGIHLATKEVPVSETRDSQGGEEPARLAWNHSVERREGLDPHHQKHRPDDVRNTVGGVGTPSPRTVPNTVRRGRRS